MSDLEGCWVRLVARGTSEYGRMAGDAKGHEAVPDDEGCLTRLLGTGISE